MNLDGTKILIVDDETDLCLVLSWEFEDVGMEVLQANSGNKAIEVLKQNSVDVVLSDIKMPDGDGVVLLEYIKEHSVPIKATYLMTGYSDYPEEELLKKGMTKLLSKPINTNDLIEELKSLK